MDKETLLHQLHIEKLEHKYNLLMENRNLLKDRIITLKERVIFLIHF